MQSLWATALAAVANGFGPAPRTAAQFSCYKKAFYPTVPGGTGIRSLRVPASMCPKIRDSDDRLEELCCANTHVICDASESAPVLVSYDGSRYPMPNDPDTVLDAAYGRLCSMMMADKCSDCKRDACSFFTADPMARSCYGRTSTDRPDGSGFRNKTTGSSGVRLSSTSECRPVQPAARLNTTEFARATWYPQQQQVTGYQSKDQFFCVAQSLDAATDKKVPFYSGKVIAVYNYANEGAVNGPAVNNASEVVLCARQTDPDDPARIINAPCFLPNVLAGDYWVIAVGGNPGTPNRYTWAIISAGAPTVPYPDGCTTKTTGTNGAGLWLFTRAPVADPTLIANMRKELVGMGYTLNELIDVAQAGCKYEGAKIKPDVL